MNTQPEALRLADALQSDFDPDWMLNEGYDTIAAELRRLHEVNQELLEALKKIMRHIPSDYGGASFSDDWWKAQRIIANATA